MISSPPAAFTKLPVSNGHLVIPAKLPFLVPYAAHGTPVEEFFGLEEAPETVGDP